MVFYAHSFFDEEIVQCNIEKMAFMPLIEQKLQT